MALPWISALWCVMARALDLNSKALDKIIIGLGNPGRRFFRNRHNIGFMVLDALARQTSGSWAPYLLSQACRTEISGCRVLLAKPSTYMNHSGKAVHALLSALQHDTRDLLLILDDLNLPFGRIRIRPKGSAGGHNGLESIMSTMLTEDITRLRIGIGEESMPEDKSDFVLSDFPPEKQTELDEMIVKAGDAVKSILSSGVAKTMALYNA
jgi:PTH1 family peptidyl-tRNA hydrolase